MTPLKNNLVALGSAAVLAVYSAGFVRTRAAAERFAVEDSERRPDRDRAPQPVVATAPLALPETPAQGKPSTPTEQPRHDTVAAQKHIAPKHDARPATDSAPKLADSSTAPVAPPVTPAPKPVEAPPVQVGREVAVKPPTPPATDSTENADKPLKDGIYSGWGTSRHGDIQATVAIKNGKITEAFISECLTRYSCSWIAALPPQVVARQSPEVDYVSGATQSTNAFYYAVIDALKKAK